MTIARRVRQAARGVKMVPMSIPPELPPEYLYLVDESRIEAAHNAMIAADRELRDHVDLIRTALDFTHRALIAEPHRNEDELWLLRLAVRCFNSASAALLLARSGYWQPAFTMARDLVETLFLLDLLSRDPEQLSRWRALPEKERSEEFKPVKVRRALDTRDGNKALARRDAYARLSRYAAHATPEGFVLLAMADNLTEVGPFPSERHLRAALQELAKHVAAASSIVLRLRQSGHSDVRLAKETYLRCLVKWAGTYFPNLGLER